MVAVPGARQPARARGGEEAVAEADAANACKTYIAEHEACVARTEGPSRDRWTRLLKTQRAAFDGALRAAEHPAALRALAHACSAARERVASECVASGANRKNGGEQ
jgi:hypothetical protein